MAYSELIKSFQKIREYMRQFYVYGFKSRSEYGEKSARSYDNERRRVESWLGEYMSFRQDAGGKKVFISVDSRSAGANPLYNALKAKSFTSGDITFHFYILDLLSGGEKYSISEIMDGIYDRYLSRFENAAEWDESSVRKKLREYEALGVLKSEKRGRELIYSRNESKIDLDSWQDAVMFYSEQNPLGVVGSYLLDKYEAQNDIFRFKHHYISHALDSQIVYDILTAMSESRLLEIELNCVKTAANRKHTVYPMKIFVSTQTGRQYLLGYSIRFEKPIFYRTDNIASAKPGAYEPDADKYSRIYDSFKQNLWGVSTGWDSCTRHIEMTVRIEDNEEYIISRLNREKRCGTVTYIDAHTYLYSADVYDAVEMIPWLRTFIGRIIKLECSDASVTERFYSDLDTMREMYGGD